MSFSLEHLDRAARNVYEYGYMAGYEQAILDFQCSLRVVSKNLLQNLGKYRGVNVNEEMMSNEGIEIE